MPLGPVSSLLHSGAAVIPPAVTDTMISATAPPPTGPRTQTPSNSVPLLTTVRSYRYALRPSPTQAQALDHAGDQGRRLWNELARLLRWAEREQRFGRREALLHEYGRLLAAKKMVGRAFTKARRLMAERNIESLQEATAVARAEQAEAARQYGRRRLALAYAVERARATAKKKPYVFCPKTTEAIIRRFAEAASLYVAGQRGQPHQKKSTHRVSLQRQIDPGCTPPVDFDAGTVDLAVLVGSECCRAVPVILHRPLPAGAKIKQIVVKSTALRTMVVLVIEAPACVFVRRVPTVPTDAVVGIDPGRRTAFSASDVAGNVQFAITPPLTLAPSACRRARRCQRLASRQLLRANRHRLDARGGWKAGPGMTRFTSGFRKTIAKVLAGRQHAIDARREAYHLAANRLLREFSVVGVGRWRGCGRAWGIGANRRGQNRKDRSNALSEFVGMLKDKAARSSRPRQILDIDEAHTTKNCPDCGEPTGPSGLAGLMVRAWTCSYCGQTHQRDFASARAIARRTLAQATAAGAQPAQPEPSKRKARTPAAPLTQARVRKARAKSPLARKNVSVAKRRRGVSAALPSRGATVVGVDRVVGPVPCSQPPNWLPPDLPLG